MKLFLFYTKIFILLFNKIKYKLNNIKTEFSIKDLENFSGVKAHTIRIWEKRYKLLEPNRTDSNIRTYNIENLQKLLNVSLLNANGLKISKIADLGESQINLKVRELLIKIGSSEQAANSFKLAMLNFDENLFNVTYNNLLATLSFRDVFNNIFIPFLNEIGLLWQINSITPAHEHFITNLIKQKVYTNIERMQLSNTINFDKVFTLFLPLNEIHDLGLLYVHYELVLRGYRSIFLGQSVPVSNLLDIKNVYDDIIFICYLTVEPSKISVNEYISTILEEVLRNTNNKLCLLGKKIVESEDLLESKNVNYFNTIDDLLNNLNNV